MTTPFIDTLRQTVDAEWATIRQGRFWRRVMNEKVEEIVCTHKLSMR